MRQSVLRFGSAALVALGIAFAGSISANAESIMKECGAEWQAAKAAGTTGGQTWQQFLKSCRTQHQGEAQAPATAPAAPSAQTAPAPTAPAATAGKTAKECNAEYAQNKAAIKAAGQKKVDFIAACRAGNETIPQGAAAAPASAPAPAPTPTSAPAPTPMAPAPTATATGAGQFATDQQAKTRCATDTVVWVNTDSGVYHFAGTHNYGHTKQGAYMCEADAKAAGDRAAKNEKHP